MECDGTAWQRREMLFQADERCASGAGQLRRFTGDSAILSLAGSVSFDGTHSSSHLHMALSTASGEVFGGHVAPGCMVRTTAEVLLALLPGWAFSRGRDVATGYPELDITKRDIKPAEGQP